MLNVVLASTYVEEALERRFISGDVIVAGERPAVIDALEVVETKGLELIHVKQLQRLSEGVLSIDRQDMDTLPWLDGVELVDGSIEIARNVALSIIEPWWLLETKPLTITDTPKLLGQEFGERAEPGGTCY